MRPRPNRSTRLPVVGACALAILAAAAAPAAADFPYAYHPDRPPDDIGGEEWKYAASPDPRNHVNNRRPTELGGIRGNHVYDRDSGVESAWQLTTGDPDVTIATLDSGIKWNEPGAMNDLRRKTRISKGEAPRPAGCAAYDCNGDGVFDVDDYAGDPRVRAVVDGPDPRRVGPAGMITPQDVLIAFSDGVDDDANGYVDDMVGWDFLDDDNDPFDDVQYGHGTGEAEGSAGEVDNGGTTGSCPNCMVIHMRVGDSFIADVNRFAAAVTYAADNDVQIVQSALGTVNDSALARHAVDYAYRHGTAMVVSAADEAAQHNNQPSLPHTILVNSVTQSAFSEVPDSSPLNPDNSYLAFNGCTNFNAKITLAIASSSCSSDAVGVGSGIAGLIYSAAYEAVERGALEPHPDCETVDGEPCPISANEVRQLMASGVVGGTRMTDDVNFLSPTGGPEPSCSPVPAPGCTGPFGSANLIRALVDANRPSLVGGPAASETYPARRGHDQFYGYGRANARSATEALLSEREDPRPSRVPPEAEIASPEWYEQVDPERATLEIEGEVFARGAGYVCEVLVAPGQYPNQARSDASPPGDFHPIANGWCDGSTVRDGEAAASPHSGVLASVDVAELRSWFPPQTRADGFAGPEPDAGVASGNGRPAQAPYSFTVKLVTRTVAATPMSGEDQRMAYLHRDAAMLDGFPRTVSGGGLASGDGASSPALADLDGDNANELVYGSSDGLVHALRPDGSEIPGWPVSGDVPGFVSRHAGSKAYAGGAVPSDAGGAILASVAIGDTDADGAPEVYAADLEGKAYGWSADGTRIFEQEANPEYSGKPLAPFENVRRGKVNRTQHGFVGSPVLVDLDTDGDQEILLAGMDRHLYAWHTDSGEPVDGYPVLVVDPAKVAEVDPRTHRVTFGAEALMNGAIVDTPAVAELDPGSPGPEIVVGTNEGYPEAPNTSVLSNPSFALLANSTVLEPGNTRLFALRAAGDTDGDPLPDDAILDGQWPVPIAVLNQELLPIVGEGITGSPIVGPADCGSNGGSGAKIGVISYASPAYVLNPDGSSCYGTGADGRHRTLATDQGASGDAVDRPIIPAVGNPAFGDLGGENPSLVVPAAGLQRALDLVLPDYQPAGQDYVAAYDTSSGQFRANFPQAQNDLSFLTGPSIADVDGDEGEETVQGTASMDLTAFNADGSAVAGFPKLTSDWTVATPLIGPFGASEEKVVVGMTRSGYVNAYETPAAACSPSSWPRFHHDNANSGDYSRDALLPGRPTGLAASGGEATFTAPGDDLLCGRVERYEAVTSNRPIDEQSFGDATPLDVEIEPGAPGARQAFAIPREARRYLALRAVDDQDNVGRVASADLRPGSAGNGSGGPPRLPALPGGTPAPVGG